MSKIKNTNLIKIIMKKSVFLTLILSIIFSFQMNAQQNEFAPNGAEWYYDYAVSADKYLHHIVSESDTIVEGYNCRILRQYCDTSDLVQREYIIRQEQGKIYYYYY